MAFCAVNILPGPSVNIASAARLPVTRANARDVSSTCARKILPPQLDLTLNLPHTTELSPSYRDYRDFMGVVLHQGGR